MGGNTRCSSSLLPPSLKHGKLKPGPLLKQTGGWENVEGKTIHTASQRSKGQMISNRPHGSQPLYTLGVAGWCVQTVLCTSL